jgi:hypothetical protein
MNRIFLSPDWWIVEPVFFGSHEVRRTSAAEFDKDLDNDFDKP